MLELNNRLILFYEFTLETTPPIKQFTISKAIERITPAYKLGNAACLIGRKEEACVRIQDMDVDEELNTTTFLINYSDSKLSNPALQKIHSDNLRMIDKDFDEGVAISIHMMLSTNINRYGNYIGVVEYVPGLSKLKYLRLFNSLFRKYCTDKVLNIKTKKAQVCYPKISSQLLDSDAITDALKKKPLSGVELIRYDKQSIDMDEDDETIVTRQDLYLKPKGKLFGSSAKQWIRKCAIRGQKNNYTDMRIKFVNPDGKHVSTTIATSEASAGEFYFAKKRLIKFDIPLNQASKTLHKELCDEMKLLLIDELDK